MTMRGVLQLILLGCVAVSLGACGNKGRLKSPAQIEAEAAKKERRKAKMQVTETPEVKGSEDKPQDETTQSPADPEVK